MNPCTEQLQRWTEDAGDGWVRVPSSAWDSALWLLRCLEAMEDAPGTAQAFKDAAARVHVRGAQPKASTAPADEGNIGFR